MKSRRGRLQRALRGGRLWTAVALAAAAPVSLAAPNHPQPGILLVHGWAGDASMWAPVTPDLGPDATAIDLPGHGADKTDVAGWPMEKFVAAMEKARIAARAPCLVVVGHSNGAYFAKEYWRRHPERVAAIVVVEGTFLKPFDKPEQMQARRAAIEANWNQMVEKPFGLDGATLETRDQVTAAMKRASRSTALATMDLLLDPGMWSDAPMPVPVTFLLADSPFWTPEHLGKLKKLAPASRFVQLGKVSHYAQLDAPQRVAKEIASVRANAKCPR